MYLLPLLSFFNKRFLTFSLNTDNSSSQHNLWNSFQQASTNVACLFKECSEFQRKMFDISSQSGYNRRTKELLTWAKKKKSYIRREELLSFLSGRSYPANHHVGNYFHHHRLPRSTRAPRGSEEIQRFLNTSSPNSRGSSRLMFNDAITESTVSSPFVNPLDNQEANNLEAFREGKTWYDNFYTIFLTNFYCSYFDKALAMSGKLVTFFCFLPFTILPHFISFLGLRTSSNLLGNNNRRSPRNSNLEDLSEFISNEYQRHVEKRPFSMDVSMDSPTHTNKRTKFC